MTFECCPDELGQQLLPLSCSSSNSQFQMILSCVHTSRHTEGWKSCTFKENTHTAKALLSLPKGISGHFQMLTFPVVQPKQWEFMSKAAQCAQGSMQAPKSA